MQRLKAAVCLLLLVCVGCRDNVPSSQDRGIATELPPPAKAALIGSVERRARQKYKFNEMRIDVLVYDEIENSICGVIVMEKGRETRYEYFSATSKSYTKIDGPEDALWKELCI